MHGDLLGSLPSVPIMFEHGLAVAYQQQQQLHLPYLLVKNGSSLKNSRLYQTLVIIMVSMFNTHCLTVHYTPEELNAFL